MTIECPQCDEGDKYVEWEVNHRYSDKWTDVYDAYCTFCGCSFKVVDVRDIEITERGTLLEEDEEDD